MSQEATPSTFSSSSFINFLESMRSSEGGLSPVMLNVTTGSSKGLNFITMGLLEPCGSLSFTRSIFSRTPSEAKSILVPQLNSVVTTDIPSLDIELMRFKLLTVPTASSIIFVIRVSTSSGAAFS